jgi:integrase
MREGNRLNALKVNRLKAPGRYSDGHGLYLQVAEGGTKAWLFRYMRNGRAHQMGLGALHTVSLAEARVRAREARQLILDEQDPLEVKRKRRDESRAADGERMLFRDAALRFLELHEGTWKNDKHRAQWKSTLGAYAFPKLGSRPVVAIDGALITDSLASIWQTTPETARRTKQRIERVLQWVREGQPLPRQTVGKNVKHHSALAFDDVAQFMAELGERESISARALEFTILTAARTGETIGATWDEIDLDAETWVIPAERMKSSRPHRVPLSKPLVAMLKALPREKGNPFVFVGARAKYPLSNMAMLELLRGMRPGHTVHGFRSSFSDWSRERTNYPRDVVEMALAHAIKDKSEAAYRRGDALEKRRRLMAEWARYCASPTKTSADVVTLRHA